MVSQVEVTQWISSKHNMGMAFDRNLWNKFLQCSSHFCQVLYSILVKYTVFHLPVQCYTVSPAAHFCQVLYSILIKYTLFPLPAQCYTVSPVAVSAYTVLTTVNMLCTSLYSVMQWALQPLLPGPLHYKVLIKYSILCTSLYTVQCYTVSPADCCALQHLTIPFPIFWNKIRFLGGSV